MNKLGFIFPELLLKMNLTAQVRSIKYLMRNLLGYKGVKENSKTIFNLIQSNNLWFMSPVPYHWWILRARDRDRDILTRLILGHQRPVNRGCPDEKYQYVNNNRLTEYPGTPAWTPVTSKSRVSNERKKSYFFPFFHLFAK